MNAKLILMLVGSTTVYAQWIAEFPHGIDARAEAVQAGLDVQESPDLLPHQVLVRGSLAGLHARGARVYPASHELLAGIPVRACAGAILAGGATPAYSATVGSWGARRITLGYVVRTMPGEMAPEAVLADIRAAMQAWSRVVQVDFVESTEPTADHTIAIWWTSGDHGDSYPFEASGQIAHTFFPPPNPEPIAGDMHLNRDESWGTLDVYSVVLHELGHALGLAHSTDPVAVMYPFYRHFESLASTDIAAARLLYDARKFYQMPVYEGEIQ